MIQNNNLTVLPWYNSLNGQNHRKSYAYGKIYPLFTPANKLLPFQIIRETNSYSISSVKLYKKDGSLFKDITNFILSAINIVNYPSRGYDVIVYNGLFPMPLQMPDGIYYAELSDGYNVWFSEMFTALNNIDNCIELEWFDVENLVFDAGAIIYKDLNFKNKLYICTELGKPEYQFEEEGETRDGYFFPEKQISEKRYKCIFLAPEYLIDAMRFIRMSDFVKIKDQYGRIYNCDTFLITPKWQTQGDLASVEIEFETNTVVKKLGKGYLLGDNGDYNNDFNNDFKNE